jgi:uncharacterized membrane protein YdbT with pleckstrin-like domain
MREAGPTHASRVAFPPVTGSRIFDRVYGVKPGREAPKLERLVWFRSYYLRNLALMVPVAILVLLFLPAWLLVVVVLPWLFGFLRLNAELRRERGRVE